MKRFKKAVFLGLVAGLVGCGGSGGDAAGSNFSRNFQLYAPVDLDAHKSGSNIDVSWEVQENELEVSYVLQRKSNQAGSEYADREALDAAVDSFRDNQGLQSGKRYYYRLKVVGAESGRVEYSDEVSVQFGYVIGPPEPGTPDTPPNGGGSSQ